MREEVIEKVAKKNQYYLLLPHGKVARKPLNFKSFHKYCLLELLKERHARGALKTWSFQQVPVFRGSIRRKVASLKSKYWK